MLQWLIQLKNIVENLYRFGRVTVVYHAGNLDFRGTDHMNIDTLVGQRLKHLGSDPGMVTHAHPWQRPRHGDACPPR